MLRHLINRRQSYIAAAIVVLIVTSIILKLYSLRHESRIRMCKAHIHEVSLSIHVYNAKYGRLPPAVVYKDGIAMHSWRVLILEVWRPDLFAQYRMTEPWNSPHNSLLAIQMPHQYKCSFFDASIPSDHTTYVAVVGADTAMRTSDEVARRIEDIPKDRLILIELPKKPRHWMSPDDASPAEVSAYFNTIDSNSPEHDHYVRSDGLVRHVRGLSPTQLADQMRVE